MEHVIDSSLIDKRVQVHLIGVGGNGAQMAVCLARLDIADQGARPSARAACDRIRRRPRERSECRASGVQSCRCGPLQIGADDSSAQPVLWFGLDCRTVPV